MRNMTEEEWTAIRNRDASRDGTFFYALKSTGTVCRPSCPSRTPNPVNVVIFETAEEALRAGFRPCSRCHPENPEWKGCGGELAEKARIYMEAHYAEKFSLESLARTLFVNRDYLLRAFRKATGKTMLQYHNEVRCRYACRLLTRQDVSISYIAQETGFTSQSHFTRVFKKMTGVTPSQYRSGEVPGGWEPQPLPAAVR